MIGTDGDDLGADLHETGEENGVLADPMHLANETDTGSLCDGEFGKIQKVGVAEMDIHIARGGLQQYVRAEWRGLGIFRVAQYRSEEHTSELQSRFGISYAVFSLKKKKHK